MQLTFRTWLDSYYGDDNLPGQLAHVAFFCDYWEGDSADSLRESLLERDYIEEALEIIDDCEQLYQEQLERNRKIDVKVHAAMVKAGWIRGDEYVPFSSSKDSIAADHIARNRDRKLGY